MTLMVLNDHFFRPFEWTELENINLKTFTDKNTSYIFADISNSNSGLHGFYFSLTTIFVFIPAKNLCFQSH